jgi:hypothetical protein
MCEKSRGEVPESFSKRDCTATQRTGPQALPPLPVLLYVQSKGHQSKIRSDHGDNWHLPYFEETP